MWLKLFWFFVMILSCGTLCGQICPEPSGTANLITNGNFSLGANGSFTSGFAFASGATSPGTWGISTDPVLKDNDFATLKDHTTGTGNMMIIDVDGTIGRAAYQTSINGIVSNTTYFFSAWFVNINRNFTNTPQLRFSVNGVQIGNIVTVSNTSRNWQQFFIAWNSGSFNGNGLVLRIDNMRNTATGNDLALDDIVFTTNCSAIENRTLYGKASLLPDTLNVCETNLPFTLNPQINALSHTYTWRSTLGLLASTNQYTLSSIPNIDKIYLCYDSIGDQITCPKIDSVILLKKINVELGPDLKLCEPVSTTLDAQVSASGVTIQWARNGSTISGSNSLLPISQTGSYQVTVTKMGCPTAQDQVNISTYSPALTNTGYYCATGDLAQFTVSRANRINGLQKIRWYNQASGGSLLVTNIINDSTIKVSSSTYKAVSGCARALWVEDENAFESVLNQPLNTASSFNSMDARTRILVQGTSVTIDSISFFSDNNTNSAGTSPYQFMIFSASNLTTPLFVSPIFNFNNTSTPALRKVPIGHTLLGSTLGISYWIMITGEIANYTNDPVYPYVNQGSTTILSTLEYYRAGSSRPSEIGFIRSIKATAGNLNPCQRTLVCADQLNCALAIEVIDFYVERLIDGSIMAFWNLDNPNDVREIYLEFGLVGKEPQLLQLPTDKNSLLLNDIYFDINAPIYLKLKVIDIDGNIDFSNAVLIKTTFDIFVYPNPSNSHFRVLSNETELSYKITSLDGLVLEAGVINDTNFELGNSLSSGFYLVTFTTINSLRQFKIHKL